MDHLIIASLAYQVKCELTPNDHSIYILDFYGCDTNSISSTYAKVNTSNVANHGNLTEVEGPVQLTLLYQLV